MRGMLIKQREIVTVLSFKLYELWGSDHGFVIDENRGLTLTVHFQFHGHRFSTHCFERAFQPQLRDKCEVRGNKQSCPEL